MTETKSCSTVDTLILPRYRYHCGHYYFVAYGVDQINMYTYCNISSSWVFGMAFSKFDKVEILLTYCLSLF